MTPYSRELDKPLGKPGRAGTRLDRRTLAIGAGAAALLAISTFVATLEPPFRNPEAPEASMQVEIVRVDPVEAQPLPPVPGAQGRQARADGPAIIRLRPDQQPGGTGVVVIRDPSAIGQDLRVAHLPDRALIEESETGPLPVRSADGRRPFDVYARPWSQTRGARVAIVIGGLGLSQSGTQSAIEALPPEVTLGFAPQGNSLGRWMQQARQKGHEIVMQLPLEPFDYPNVDPGRNTLTVAASAEENAARLRWALSRTTNYTGVMNYMGARFTADHEAMAPLLAELGRRGLMYLDDGSSARSAAADLAPLSAVPYAAADLAIDSDQARSAILGKLDQLEAEARARGFALGTGSAFATTVEAVRAWTAEARKRGIEIVPVSALAADPERR